MRLLVYTHEYPPYRGGAGALIETICRGLSGLGVEVQVVAPRYHDSDVDSSERFRIRRLSDWQLIGRYGARVLLKLCVSSRADLLLIPEYEAAVSASSAFGMLPPYIALLHGTEVWRFCDAGKTTLSESKRSQLNDYLRHASSIVCVSNATRQLLLSYMPELSSRIKVVLPGIACDQLGSPTLDGVRSWRKKLECGSRKIVLTVGRLASDKGHDTLLKAASMVNRTDFVVVLVGDGPDRVALQELAHQLGIADIVRFTGIVSDQDRADLLDACDVFALPSRSESRWEGFGLVFLEAGYFSKPVVGCASGGVPEAIEDGVTGYVVPVDDAAAVAGRISDLLESKSLRTQMGSEGQRRVINHFTARRMSSEVYSVLDGVLSKRGRANAFDRICLATKIVAYLLFTKLCR